MRCRRKKGLLIFSALFYISIIALFINLSTGYFPSVFVKYAANPVFAAASQSPCVFRFNSTHLVMYYDNGVNVLVRLSTDGVTWSALTLAFANARLCYVWHNGTHYRMLYNPVGGPPLQEIRLATSITPTGFVDQGQLLAVGVGTWDSNRILSASEIEVGNIHYLYYTGAETALTSSYQIGLATSNTGNPGSYTKQGVVLDSFGRENGVFDAEVHLAEDNQYVMIYSAFNATLQESHICLAKNYSSLSNWDRLKTRFISYSQTAWESPLLLSPSFLIENGQYRVWYDANTLRIGYAWALFEATEDAYTDYESIHDGNVLWNGQVALKPNSNHTYYHKFTGRYENITLSSGTLGLSKGSSAYSIRCTTSDVINIRLHQWFNGDGYRTQYNPISTTGVDVTMLINTRVAGAPQGVIGDISWSFDETSNILTVLSASGSTVTLVFQSAGTQVIVWYLERIPLWVCLIGIAMCGLSPAMFAYYTKQGNIDNAFVYPLCMFVIGMALIIGYAWG